MLSKKTYLGLLITNVVLILIYSFIFIKARNYEFIMYVGVIIFFLFVIRASLKKVAYPAIVLWGLTIWSFLHMTGGGIYIKGQKVYQI